MERKQLMERLESMKKEFARKQRKLEKANRAAKVKAHVRKKIQELNLQVTDNQQVKVPEGQLCQQPKVTEDQQVKITEDEQDNVTGGQQVMVTEGQQCQQVKVTNNQQCQPVKVTDNEPSQKVKTTDSEQCRQVTDGQLSRHSLSTNDLGAQTASRQNVSSSYISVATKDQQHPKTHHHRPSGNMSPGSCVSSVKISTSVSSRGTLRKPANSSKDNFSHPKDIKTSEETKTFDLQTERNKTLVQFKASAFDSDDKCCDGVKKSGLGNIAVGQDPDAVSDNEDSLMITPTFRGLRDTDANLTENHLHPPPLDLNMDSYANTFTLNLNSEDSLSDCKSNLKLTKDFLHCENSSKLQDKNVSNVAVVSQNDSENVCPAKTRVLEDSVTCQNASTSLNTKISMVTSKQESDRAESPSLPPLSMSSSVPISKPVLTSSSLPDSIPKSSLRGAQLRLQDISSGEDADLPRNSRPKASASEEACHNQFLDYTELDAIPFSQFELTEDFLSECSQYAADGGQSRKGKRGISSLVQRRSPRLSSFEFENCDISEKRRTRHLRTQQSALYRMARKQKKTKKALFLSSLFQYLIDEAKRNPSFVEFQLPDDIRDSASLSCKGTLVENQNTGSVVQSSGSEEYTADSLDPAVIPETEVIPDSDEKLEMNSEGTEDSLCSEEKSESNTKDSSVKVGLSVRKTTQQDQDTTKVLVKETGTSAEGVPQHAQGRTDISVIKTVTGSTEKAQHEKDKSGAFLQQAEAGGLQAVQHDVDRLETSPDRKIKSSPTAETLSSPPTDLTDSNSANNKNQNLNRETENQEIENKALAKLIEDAAEPTDATRADQSDLVPKAENADVHTCISLHVQYSENRIEKPQTTSADNIQHCSISRQSPNTEMCTPGLIKDSTASPVLFNTQHQSNGENRIPDSQREQIPVFTPSKHRSGDEPVETVEQIKTQGKCWVHFDGCAESGSADAVVDMVVGTVVSDSGEVSFILSVQTSALTLWTLDTADQQWSAEFHWYLDKTCRAEGACKVYTADRHLEVLVWGFDEQSVVPHLTLTVFVYNWDTQHTQRFGLPLPSPVCPVRVFCQGLPSSADSVVVFTTDKATTAGRRYCVDRRHGCVGVEIAMEEVNTQVTDLCLVDRLDDAVVGLTEDQSLLIWNHQNGSLIVTLPLPGNLLAFSRMYTCYSLKGYLLFHMSEGDRSAELSLVAVNPTTGFGKLLRTLTTHSGQHSHWRSVAAHQDSLVAVSTSGTAHLWDPYLGELVSISTPSSKSCAAAMIQGKERLIVITGQDSGCLHLFSVGP